MNALLYAAVCLIWGSTWLVIKIGLDGVPPFLGAGLRFLSASAALWVVVLLRGARPRLTRDDKISILSCGLLSFTASYACVYWAEQYISSGLTAVLFSTMPLLTALLSRFWTRSEALGGRRLAGILTGAGGTALLFWPREGGLSRAELWAMGCALLGSLSAAVNLVMMRRHSRGTDIYLLNAAGMAMAAACLLGLSLLGESWAAVSWSRSNVLATAYLAAFGSVAAFLAFYHLVKHMEATLLSMISLIFPLVAVFLGRVFLGEKITGQTLAGVAVVLVGVAAAALPQPRS